MSEMPTIKTGLEPTNEQAERASERIQAWYNQLGPRLGAFLTNPNVVLTLANARGFTEFSTDDLQDGDEVSFASLNELSQTQGIYFEPHIIEDTDTPHLYVEVFNLPGLEFVTGATTLPGVARFYASAGRDGFSDWVKNTQAAVDAARDQGAYPIETKAIVVASGVARGYPDQAVLANLKPMAEGRVSDTYIPYADYYDCEQPNYSYDAKDKAIIAQHVAKWGSILEQYYHSPIHQELEASEEFRRARGR